MTEIRVLIGDATQIGADALIAAVSLDHEDWNSDIDTAIRESSDEMFHDQLAESMPLEDGQIVYASASGHHGGQFGAVLFAADNLQQPVYDLVTDALAEADYLGLTSVSIPLLRTGCRMDKFEEKVKAVRGLIRAVLGFANHNSCVQVINIVISDDEDDKERLLRALRAA